jgi:hypothetical protein
MSDTKDYLVLISQGDDGCDYTIGCGMTWEVYHLSRNHEKAAVEATIRAFREYGEDRVSEVSLVPMPFVIKANVQHVRESLEREKNEKELSEIEAEERAELERLKNKYRDG